MIDASFVYRFCTTVAVGVVACGFASSTAADDPAKSKPAGSLDDELLKGLGGEQPAKKTPTSDQTKPARPGATELDDELLKGLGGDKKPEKKTDAQAPSGDDPIARLTEQMRQVEQSLRRSQPDEQLKPRQEEIVRALDELIKKLRQQQQQQQSSSSSKGSQQTSQARQQVSQPKPGGQSQQPGQQPATDSSDELKRREAAKVDMAKMQEMLKDIWGQLPPRLREQMLQSGAEKFVPKYELLIEQYFKTLAERQTNEGP